MKLNFRLVHTAAAAGGVVMGLGLLIVGGDPGDGEGTLIILASYAVAGCVMGILPGRRDQPHRREEARCPDDRRR